MKKSQVYNLKLLSLEKAILSKNNDQAVPHHILLQMLQRKHCKMCFWYSSQDTSVWCSAKPQTLLGARQEFENTEPSFSPLIIPGAQAAGRAWMQCVPQLPSCRDRGTSAPQPGKVPVLDKRAPRVQWRLPGSFAPWMGMKRQSNNHIFSCEHVNWCSAFAPLAQSFHRKQQGSNSLQSLSFSLQLSLTGE